MIGAEDILARVEDIPPLPGTVIRLMNVLNDPASTVNDIVEIVKYDQAVTTQMLRLCNSAYFGLSHQVNSLNDAMRYLGTTKVMQLLMAVHANSLLSKAQPGYGLDPGILWKHSVAVALASTTFAQRVNLANANLAFTAGLLHDIGKVVLNEHVGQEFTEIVRLCAEQKLAFSEAETQVLVFSHAEVGGLLAEAWSLPEPIIRAIRHHLNPSELDPPDPLVDIVCLSDCLCMILGIGLGSDGLRYRADSSILERYNLNETDLELVGAEVMIELKDVEMLFADASLAGTQESSGTPAGGLS